MSSYNSHTRQVLQNYFDHADQRARFNPAGIEAQLLNVVGQNIEDFKLRFNRELAASNIFNCPTNIDNGGVYYSAQLDNNYDISNGLTTVQASNGSGFINLTAFDDRLPVPAGYKIDTNRTITPFASQVITTLIGSGSLTNNGYWDLQTYTNEYTMPIPNRLTFILANTNQVSVAVKITITGYKYPSQVWADQQVEETEQVTITSEGIAYSLSPWQTISSIFVLGLPVGALLQICNLNIGLTYIPDPSRPYTDSLFRQQTFPRYWQITPNQIQEIYQVDNLSGFNVAKPYLLSGPINTLAIEPNTWGMIATVGNNLIYCDRREPIPTNLLKSGIYSEPLYGLDVYYDETQTSMNYIVSPVAYQGAPTCLTYRYILTDPSNNQWIWNTDGSWSPFTPSYGWTQGQPRTIGISFTVTGSYLVTLQCQSNLAVTTQDVFALAISSFNDIIKGTYSIANLAGVVQGIGYDMFNNLWIWDGNFLIPIVPYYNGYILDIPNHMLYLTDSWTTVNYE